MHHSKDRSRRTSATRAATLAGSRARPASCASLKLLIRALCNTLAIGAGSVGPLAASAAQQVQLVAEERSFDIPAQPVAAALMQFSRQANVQIIADAGKLGDARSQSLSGRFRPAEAISILLSRTGLIYEVTASNTIVVSSQKLNAGHGPRLISWNGDGGRMLLAQATQTVEPGPSAAAPANSGPAPLNDNATTLEEVAVTATRIQRNGFNAPTPTTIVGVDEIEARAAVNVSSVLYEMPSVRAAASMTVATQNQGGNFVNLRGLGATRTLTLVDGRRFVPTTNTGIVDINAIPSALVERIEVVTGGASAAWGSDAVSGVINLVLKKKIEGFQGSAQFGLSEHGDNRERTTTLAWGSDFADGRGQFMIAGEFSKLDQVAMQYSRDWGRHRWGWVPGVIDGRPVARIPMQGVTASGITDGGVIVAPPGSPLRGIQFGTGGKAIPFHYGTNVGANLMVGGDGGVDGDNYPLATPLERKNVFARTTFDITDQVSAFAELSYAESYSLGRTMPDYTPNGEPIITIQRDNAYLDPAVRAIMTDNDLQSFNMGRRWREFNDPYLRVSGSNKVTRGAIGLEGTLDNGWGWDAHIASGKTTYAARSYDHMINANLRAAIDTVVGPDGMPICRIDSTNPADIAIVSAPNYQGRGAAAGCVPLNPFGSGSVSAAAAAYSLGTMMTDSTIKQDVAGVSIHGEPFSTWADVVSVTAGIDYRRESASQDSDPISRFVTPAFPNGGWKFGNPKQYGGHYNVTEYFAETVVPLLKDLPFARSLELNAAARNTDYSTSGKVTSWKGGLTYSPFRGLLLRGTRSKDIRAANILELFSSAIPFVGTITDYGLPGNPTSFTATSTSGNPQLKPEKGDTTTLGITWQPPQIPGLLASVDYYTIDLKDAISSLGGQNIVNFCYGAQGAPLTPSLCSLIQRDPSTGVITNIANKTLNIAAQKTSGVDLELSYRLPVPGLLSPESGSLLLRVLGTYVDELIVNNGLNSVDRAGEGSPQWRWTGSATYNNGPWTLYLQGVYTGETNVDNTFTAAQIADNTVDSQFIVNASVQRTLYESGRGRLQLFGNVTNLLDQDPPVSTSSVAYAWSAPLGAGYDKIGRAYSIGVRFSY
ncbi:MAG TPA: TonB-dependent receptor [Povalibacter sp.]|nr:TonB-dependent receptor [Povalibacter sp.]